MSKKVDKTVSETLTKARRWLATEFYFFQQLKNDLTFLKRDLDNALAQNQVQDIKKALRDCKYIGRSEQRLENAEQEVEHVLEQYSISIPKSSVKEIEELVRRIRTEAANLIKDASLYEGRIRALLQVLQSEVKHHELDKARQILAQLQEIIENAKHWMGAFATDLQSAQRIFEHFRHQSMHFLTWTEIEEQIKKVHSLEKRVSIYLDYIKRAKVDSFLYPTMGRAAVVIENEFVDALIPFTPANPRYNEVAGRVLLHVIDEYLRLDLVRFARRIASLAKETIGPLFERFLNMKRTERVKYEQLLAEVRRRFPDN